MADEQPLLTFESEVSGLSSGHSKVSIFGDRVEWEAKKRGISVGKIVGGVLTGGASLLVTGVGEGSYGVRHTGDSEVLPIDAVTSVSTHKDGRVSVLRVMTASGEVAFKAQNNVVDQAKQMLVELMRQRGSQAAVQAAPAAPSGAALTEIRQMYEKGLLTEDEFAAAKRKVLGI